MIEPIEMDVFDSHEDIDIPDDVDETFPLLPERVETGIQETDFRGRTNVDRHVDILDSFVKDVYKMLRESKIKSKPKCNSY